MAVVADAGALGKYLQASFRQAGLGESEIARRINVRESAVIDVMRGALPSAAMLESMLALLPIGSALARDVYVTRAQIEAEMHWQSRRGKDAVAALQQPGALEQNMRATRVEPSASRSRRGTGPRPSRYVPKSGQPDPTGVSSPAELQQALQAVHVWGGSPSLRDLEKHSDGVLRRSTISDMLRGAEPSVPDYDRYIAFLRACGIDDASLDTWVFTWRRLVALQQSPEVAGWMSGMATRA
ncbi:hypothetical protein [Streptomyces sp. NPDC058667]|uniref:hypothetical protein n=1 Tax=Streptomyces sp. NPDC058667 TaxID=3346588 RepID=UPI00365EF964